MACSRFHRFSRAAIALFAALLLAPFLTANSVDAAPGDRLVAVYRVRPAGDQGIAAEGMAALQLAIQQRLATYGIADPVVRVQEGDQIGVEIPESRDARTVAAQIGQIGLCEFVGSAVHLEEGSTITTSLGGPAAVGSSAGGTQADATATAPASAGDTVYPTLLQNADFADVVVRNDRTAPVPTITFTLREAAAQAFADYTGAHVGQYISIVVDKRVVSSALLRDRINGVAELQGTDLAQMRAIAAYIRSGPLVIALDLVDLHTERATA